jgi:hypothetical protein
VEIAEDGHVYRLAHIDGEGFEVVRFVNREEGTDHPGTQTQEVIRALIDRTQHCHRCLPHDVNDKIIWHLRMALVLHESRALERKVEKRLIEPEHIEVGDDGHFALTE